MSDEAFLLGSLAICNHCEQTLLTRKEARKKDMFVLRYPTGLKDHVVVSIAALSLSELQGSLSLHTVFCVAALCLLASQRLSVAL